MMEKWLRERFQRQGCIRMSVRERRPRKGAHDSQTRRKIR